MDKAPAVMISSTSSLFKLLSRLYSSNPKLKRCWRRLIIIDQLNKSEQIIVLQNYHIL